MDKQQLVSLRWAARHQFYPATRRENMPGSLLTAPWTSTLQCRLPMLPSSHKSTWVRCRLETRESCKGAEGPQATSHLLGNAALLPRVQCYEDVQNVFELICTGTLKGMNWNVETGLVAMRTRGLVCVGYVREMQKKGKCLQETSAAQSFAGKVWIQLQLWKASSWKVKSSLAESFPADEQ